MHLRLSTAFASAGLAQLVMHAAAVLDSNPRITQHEANQLQRCGIRCLL